MKEIKPIIVTFFILSSAHFINAQCTNPILVTPANIYQIHNPYQFTFIHKIPVNSVDTFVEKLTNEFSDWNKLDAMVQNIAASRTNESFYFLYASCLVSNKLDQGNNLFHSISNLVCIHGGFKLLNKYFLNNSVNETLPELKFRKKVLLFCKKRKMKFYFCSQPTALELYNEQMKSIKIENYDKAIIKIIEANSDLRKGNNADSITKQVTKLPFVTDVLWDGCYEKIDIYPTFYNLGVNMMIDGKLVERCYYIKGSKLRYVGLHIGKRFFFSKRIIADDFLLDYKSCSFSPGFIEAARTYCKSKR